MTKEITEFELFSEVQKNYKGYLTMDKALKLFEMENGYIPTIVEKEVDTYAITQSVIDKINEIENSEITIKQMVWMKQMQEKGTYNMIVGEICNAIQTTFLLEYEEAREVQKVYMKYYTELYMPEELI